MKISSDPSFRLSAAFVFSECVHARNTGRNRMAVSIDVAKAFGGSDPARARTDVGSAGPLVFAVTSDGPGRPPALRAFLKPGITPGDWANIVINGTPENLDPTKGPNLSDYAARCGNRLTALVCHGSRVIKILDITLARWRTT